MLPPSLVYPYPQEVERDSARGEEEERRVGTEHLQETARRDALHPTINEKEEDSGEVDEYSPRDGPDARKRLHIDDTPPEGCFAKDETHDAPVERGGRTFGSAFHQFACEFVDIFHAML